jgi:hypothetical protein
VEEGTIWRSGEARRRRSRERGKRRGEGGGGGGWGSCRGRQTQTGKLKILTFSIVHPRVSDPHWFNADPDPAFFLIADPDSGSRVWWPKIEKIYSWKFNFYFLDQKLQFTYP